MFRAAVLSNSLAVNIFVKCSIIPNVERATKANNMTLWNVHGIGKGADTKWESF